MQPVLVLTLALLTGVRGLIGSGRLQHAFIYTGPPVTSRYLGSRWAPGTAGSAWSRSTAPRCPATAAPRSAAAATRCSQPSCTRSRAPGCWSPGRRSAAGTARCRSDEWLVKSMLCTISRNGQVTGWGLRATRKVASRLAQPVLCAVCSQQRGRHLQAAGRRPLAAQPWWSVCMNAIWGYAN